MRRRLLILIALGLAGCVQLPLTPEDLEARKFEAVPDKAVIYVVRDYLDFSNEQAPIYIGEKLLPATYPGTYFRLVVPAGKHTIVGYGQDSGAITVEVQQGRIYFVQQRVTHFRVTNSGFEVVSEAQGRAAVLRSVLLTTS
jgi:hypothetical protein